jgi:type IV/VI secretion system ImpK/VasF family protein
MKLLETYEDFFQYICRLNRAAKTQAQPEYARVRGEIKDLLGQVIRNASADARLLSQVKRLELPIIFFTDYLLCTSKLKFATQWAENRLAKERNELAGDERFFDLLEEDLKDTSEDAAERLGVYYVCLGLGFMGMYQSQPEQIRRYIEQIWPRIYPFVDRDPRTKISEEAYQHTDTRVLTEPPSSKIIFVAIAFVFLSLSVIVTSYALYAHAVHDLKQSVSTIQGEAQKAAGGPK